MKSQDRASLLACLALITAAVTLTAGQAPAQNASPPAITTGLSAAAQPVFTQSVALAQATSVIQAAPGDSREVRRIRELEGLLTTAVNERDAARSGGASALAAAEARLSAARATYAAEADRLFNELRLAQDELDRYKADLATVLVSATPEELELRQRFADGDFARFDRLQELRRTRQAAGRARLAQAQAAEVRTEAETYSASLARATPGATSAALLAIWDEAAELDGSDFWTHIERSRLAVTIGDLPRALAAARQASAAATTDRERSAAFNEQGNIAFAQGSLPLATRAYQESLAIARRLALADQGSAAAARDLSIGLERVGDVAVARGDLAAAGRAYDESLAIARRLALADPSSAAAARDLSVGLVKVGDVALDRGDLAAARSHYEESLAILRRLALADPSSAAARDLSVGLNRVGDVALARGDLAAARSLLEESLPIARRLALADPSSAAAAQDLAFGLERVGNVARARGDLTSAAGAYLESLAIRRRLAMADPSSAAAARDLGVSLERLARIPGSGVRWADVAAHFRDMQARGMLAPADQRFLADYERRAAQEAGVPK